MRSKAPLALIEQVVMLLVFALAAVVCLWAFVWADVQSKETVDREQALIQAQSAAEVLKHCDGDCVAAVADFGGTWDGDVWTIQYDDDWQQTEGEGTYVLQVSHEESGSDYLGLAAVEVFQEQKRLAALDIAWQEVGDDG